MAMEASGSLSCFAPFLSPPIKCRQSCLISLRQRSFVTKQNRKHLTSTKAKPWTCRFGMLKSTEQLQRKNCFPVVSEDFFPEEVIELSGSGTEELPLDLDGNVDDEGVSPTVSYEQSEGSGGKPGFVSFYSLQSAKENVVPSPSVKKNQNSLLWFAGPAVLVASFILPSLYLRRIISLIFEDSLLTDFLILFFTEALFYCGVAVFLLIHFLWSPGNKVPATSSYGKLTTQMGHRISSVAILMLSLIIPMVTMGFVWPWTGPAASAALAPYLVGIVVQFAFEQYAKYTKSPSWPVIPVVFQVYRLHQLNRAAQLVTALSFTVRGAEMTAHNLAINNSLGTLLSVLQILGLICIWSLSSFLMRFFPSSILEQ
ncbi:uncharacterized protein LOC110727612 isoform X2 [Chenopodium quinoa]|uniref:uncharacterized protein LOC110727612 isoform X2 n=1 Tax=Chenopodium quinoa TaxID=63459 RepID=UPI000B7737E0|nr:uncharacterized protein LOC110727612 isoform X2 [Chenopodium quinoa]